MPAAATSRGELEHQALFYDDRTSFLDGTVPFIHEGLSAGDAVLVVVDRSKIDLLHSALGEAAADVEFADMRELGRNPARIIPAWQEFVDSHGARARRVRGIGEPVWAGRSDCELSECHLHEALLNVAFTGDRAFPLLCPYDTTGLTAATLERAHHTHPWVRPAGRGLLAESSSFAPDDPCGLLFAEPLPDPPPHAVTMEFGARSLRQVRGFVADTIGGFGLSAQRREDLLLGTSEVTTNSVRHGGGAGVVTMWTDDTSAVVEVADGGVIADPLAGRRRPAVGARGGRGLWLANAVCDLVQLRTGITGTVVRLHVSRV